MNNPRPNPFRPLDHAQIMQLQVAEIQRLEPAFEKAMSAFEGRKGPVKDLVAEATTRMKTLLRQAWGHLDARVPIPDVQVIFDRDAEALRLFFEYKPPREDAASGESLH